MPTPLRYLQRKQIDTQQWDRCIAHATNGLLYAHSFYLDHMASGDWDALVLGDYEAVMPLPWRRKFGISYLYQPFVTSPLGVFSVKHIDSGLMATFLQHIPAKFKLVELDLNVANNCLNGQHIIQRKNYILSLNGSYQTILQQYNRHARRKLKKAAEAQLKIVEGIDVAVIAELSYRMMEAREKVPMADYQRFIKLCKKIQPYVETCGSIAAVDAAGTIIASDVYIVHNKRVYSLLAGNLPQSNECGAFYFVLDALIQKYAGTGYLFDFEGSDVPGIAFLFECLGGKLTWYPHLIINKLPPLVRWLKQSKYE